MVCFQALAAIMVVASQSAPAPQSVFALCREASNYCREQDYVESRDTIARWQQLPKESRIVLISCLVRRLQSDEKVRLRNTEDTIIWNRLLTGELKFQGHGLIINQDLFIVGGKAAWAIGELISVNNLPMIVEGQTNKERAEIIKTIRTRIDFYIKND